jgi:voltage-gated potassium channel
MPNRRAFDRERWQLLRHLDALLEGPMIALGLLWLGLLIADLTVGLNRWLRLLSDVIWAIFVLDFALGLLIAPEKLAYVRRNWLTAIALFMPALRVLRVLRVFRVLRAVRATRSLSLVRLVTSLNRGAGALRGLMGRRGVGYVVALTTIVTFAGAAGMTYFESPAALVQSGLGGGQGSQAGLTGYGDALWWTAMTMTTLGTDYSPKTAEGRTLAWLLALYAFAVFGYVTATIASLLVDREVVAPAHAASGDDGLEALRREIRELRAQLADAARLDERH